MTEPVVGVLAFAVLALTFALVHWLEGPRGHTGPGRPTPPQRKQIPATPPGPVVASCASCRFWVRADPTTCSGECRRWSPAQPGPRGPTTWPETDDRDVCGEHEGRRPPGSLGGITR